MFRETAFLEPFEKITKETCIVACIKSEKLLFFRCFLRISQNIRIANPQNTCEKQLKLCCLKLVRKLKIKCTVVLFQWTITNNFNGYKIHSPAQEADFTQRKLTKWLPYGWNLSNIVDKYAWKTSFLKKFGWLMNIRVARLNCCDWIRVSMCFCCPRATIVIVHNRL